MRAHIKILTILLLVAATVAGSTDALAQRGRGGGERGEPGRGLPTVDAMADAIDANAEQRAALAEARLAFLEAVKERRAERGGRGQGPGRRGRRGHDGPRTQPVMEFLVDVAPVMDTQDMIALVDVFSENRPGRRGGDRPGMRSEGRRGEGLRGEGPRGDGPRAGIRRGGRGPRHDDMLVHQLDLTDEQQEQVEALYATTLGALRALRGRVDPGEEPSEALVAEAERVRADHQSRLKEILTDAQNTELLQLRAERMATRSAEGAERRAAVREKRIADMTAILDLDARQVEAVTTALETMEQEMSIERGERMSKGGPMPHLFHTPGQGRALRTETREAISEQLEPDQRELFARLQALGLEGRSGGRRGHHGRR